MTWVAKIRPWFEFLLGRCCYWRWIAAVHAIVAVTTVKAATVAITNAVVGEGILIGTGVFEIGDRVTLRAVPQVDWKFDHWESVPESISRLNPMTFELSDSIQPRAVFSRAVPLSKGELWGGLAPIPDSELKECRHMSVGHEHVLLLRGDGRVTAWGADTAGQSTVPEDLTGTVQVDAGYQHSLARISDGTVRAWGWNSMGQIRVPASATNLIEVAAGGQHSLGLRRDGSVVGWGSQADGESKPPAGLGRVVQIAAGNGFSVVLCEDGTVRSWGYNANGESTVPADLKDVVQISARWAHTLALKRVGSVVAWGKDHYGDT